MRTPEEVIQHYGVKGMRWGILRNRNQPGGADGVDNSKTKEPGRIGKHLNSLKRERQWRKVLREVDKLSTKDIGAASKRIGLENSLKRLSRTKGVGKAKDREDYLRRDKMDDQELSRKVVRLQAKENLYKNVSKASLEQRELGEKLVRVGSALSIKYALTKTFDPQDVLDAWKDPKGKSGKAKDELIEEVKKRNSKTTADILKYTLDKIDSYDAKGGKS